MNALAAAAMALAFWLCLATGATERAAFMAWLGAALSPPLVVYSASPFPEVSGAFFATLAATLLWRSPVVSSAGSGRPCVRRRWRRPRSGSPC
jgi:hypothetical protein